MRQRVTRMYTNCWLEERKAPRDPRRRGRGGCSALVVHRSKDTRHDWSCACFGRRVRVHYARKSERGGWRGGPPAGREPSSDALRTR